MEAIKIFFEDYLVRLSLPKLKITDIIEILSEHGFDVKEYLVPQERADDLDVENRHFILAVRRAK